MVIQTRSLECESLWNATWDELKERTVMVIGAAGTGKSWLARQLVAKLNDQPGRAALVSADMGQPSVGVPTCLALSMAPPWDRPVAQWFVGDISPVGHLLPTVVGTARLVERAREEGARSVVIDTGGLVYGGVGRALKYHQALAAHVERVVAIQREQEIALLIHLLDDSSRQVIVCPPSHEATDRSRQERRAYRRQCYRAHFDLAQLCPFSPERLIGLDWAPVSAAPVASARFAWPPVSEPPSNGVVPGTVVGLLDPHGYCARLGIIDAVHDDSLLVYSTCREAASIVRIQVGKVQIDRRSFAERTVSESTRRRS